VANNREKVTTMKTCTMWLATAALLIGVAAPARAQQTITFDQAVGIALRQNVSLLQARNAASQQSAQVTQQKLQFLPSLSLSTQTGQSYGRSFSQSEGQVIDQTTNTMNAGVTSSVTLFDGLRNVRQLEAAKAGERAGEHDLARTRQTVVFTVASNFLAVVSQHEQVKVQEGNLAALEAQAAQIRRFVEAGTRPVSDQYQQEASVAAARAALVDARNALDGAKVDIMRTLQLDPTAEYEFVAPQLASAGTSAGPVALPPLDSLVARALAQRVDLDAQLSRVDEAKQGVKAAEAGRWPTLSVSAGYNTAFTTANALSFSEQLDQRRGGSVGVGVSIPLFDRGSTTLAAQQAKIQEDNARLALASQRQEVALQVRKAWLDVQAAGERLKAAEAQRAAADLAVEASSKRYEVGAATLVELTQARAAQLQAASALVNARYSLAFQRSLVSYYTGDLDPAKVSIGE
jgi:outer membrane protein